MESRRNGPQLSSRHDGSICAEKNRSIFTKVIARKIWRIFWPTLYLPGNLPGAAAPVPEDPQKHVRPYHSLDDNLTMNNI